MTNYEKTLRDLEDMLSTAYMNEGDVESYLDLDDIADIMNRILRGDSAAEIVCDYGWDDLVWPEEEE